MKLKRYIEKMEEAFNIAAGCKGERKIEGYAAGYVEGHLEGHIDGIRYIAMEDPEISSSDYDFLIAYSRKLKEVFDEGKSI